MTSSVSADPTIAADPRETLGALTNAVIKLGQEPGVRLDEWLGGIEALGATALRVLATHWSSDPDARATLDLARSGANRVLRAAAGGAR